MNTRRILLSICGAALLCATVAAALWYRDFSTRRGLLLAITKELPPNASMAQMDRFMRKHTQTYGVVDDDYASEFGGFARQTKIDVLFDRKVSVILQFDRETKTFQRADVRVEYTVP
jgi:hypothetical protein